MRRLLILSALVLATTAGAANAADYTVTIPGLRFDPARLSVLVGDTVTWENEDTQFHTATSDDGSFDSDLLGPGESFSQAFSVPGSYRYVCAIHSFMRGEIDVFSIALSTSADAIRPGGQATLSGRAPADTTEVTIEERGTGGAYSPIATVSTGTDGSFTFDVFPRLPTTYRAVAGELESPSVLVSVSARAELRFAGRTDRGTWLLALTRPAQSRAPVRLERYARELFTWVPYARGRLDAEGTAMFLVSPRRLIQVRLVVLRGVKGYGPATSPPVRVRPA